jgi:hypothetical protein
MPASSTTSIRWVLPGRRLEVDLLRRLSALDVKAILPARQREHRGVLVGESYAFSLALDVLRR